MQFDLVLSEYFLWLFLHYNLIQLKSRLVTSNQFQFSPAQNLIQYSLQVEEAATELHFGVTAAWEGQQ